MTDDRVTPGPDPTDDTARRLRRTLAAAAPAETDTEAGLDDLRRRLGGATVVPLARERSPRVGHKAPMLAAAAVFLLVVAAVVAVVVSRRGEDSQRVSGTEGPSTGWYVPTRLPDGWRVDSITSDFRDVEGFGGTCPCSLIAWAPPRRSQLLTLATAKAAGPTSEGLFATSRTVELGRGVSGEVGLVGVDIGGVRWRRAGRVRVMFGVGLDEAALLGAARRVVAHEASTAAPIDGFSRIDSATNPGGVRSFQAVTVKLVRPSSRHTVSYTVVPSGFGNSGFGFLRRASVPGQPQSLLSLRHRADEGVPEAKIYLGRWVGADVEITNACDACGASGSPASDRELRKIIAALRPADAASWASFVRSAGAKGDRTVAVGSIDDLTKPGEAVVSAGD